MAIANAARISSLENILKKHEGTVTALARDGVLARLQEEEAALRERLPSFDAIHGELRRALDTKRVTRERDAVLGLDGHRLPAAGARPRSWYAWRRTAPGPTSSATRASRPATSTTSGRGWSARRSRSSPAATAGDCGSSSWKRRSFPRTSA